MSNLSRQSLTLAGCGYCGLEGPDSFGNYDLIESSACPYHGAGEAPIPAGNAHANTEEPGEAQFHDPGPREHRASGAVLSGPSDSPTEGDS